ncbi:TPA_asm: maturation protein [ssRNA phage Gerhypos.4_51]|uniref:Maturation protein n=1 Tax=ssRNA phage Gerhypos.4_51 TaxID=2786355 RepID=A0A8S5KYT3_9VIRU|nr:maturation protein [ssRNA phage Gerhypos.4_51]DAD50205.1 TPA_asm: maturation protein [ssRNA phage Gerhypos.4_51]
MDHVEVEAELSYVPSYTDSYPAASGLEPTRIGFRCFNSSGSKTTIYAPRGLGVDGQIGIYYKTHYIVSNSDPYTFSVVQYDRQAEKGAMWSAQFGIIVSTFTYLGVVSNKPQYRQTQQDWTVNWKDFVSTWEELTPAIVLQAASSPRGDIKTLSTTTYAIYTAQTAASLSVESVRRDLRIQEIDHLLDVEFPLEDVHPGILAMKAAQKMNANQTNMIAFIRDLRNPKQLIPKLKKLDQLKTHASNYLAFEYGVLPTISDLQEIIGSLKKIKPYVDRNGFSTYSAGHTDSLSIGNYTFELEQHVKVAVDDNDSGLSTVLRNLESSGFAPTLQNIWDLIPYSFVIDWFLDIGSVLERVDSGQRLLRHDIRFSTESRKEIIRKKVTPSATFPLSGDLSIKRYSRGTQDQCPVPPLTLSSTPTVTNHWLEASALIIQRQK